MAYPVTTLTVSLLGLWLFWLSVRVIQSRGKAGVNDGDGGDTTLSRRIRAQGNLAEYTPFVLILLFLSESQGANFWVIAGSAASLVFGRLIHGIAFSFTDKWVFGRVGGMLLTFASLVSLSVTNLWLIVT